MRTSSKLQGFTLLEIAVVLTIIAVILGGSLSLLVARVRQAAFETTIKRMNAIDKALADYSNAFDRLPCPASLTLTSSSTNYGFEAGSAAGGVGTGECVVGMTPAANYPTAGGSAEEGAVPVRTLQLPDIDMYDGWGRRFRYAVDPDYTATNSRFIAACSTGAKYITINSAAGGVRTTNAIYALISHGPNGHGAYTASGQVLDANSANADEHTNCHCDSSGAFTSYNATYVEKALTSNPVNLLDSFDDIVTFRESWQLNTSNNPLQSACSSYYRAITIDHTKVSNTDQSSFPMLFSGTYSYLATQANGGSVQNSNGYDIYFSSDAAGTQILPFERELYNASSGQVVFWVQIPTVSHTTDTSIYLHYDNGGITSDLSNKNETWDSNYMGVWHLDETSGTQYDSTSNKNDFTTVNTISQGTTTTAKIGGADKMGSSSDNVDTAGSNSSLLPLSVTLESWVNLTAFNGSGNSTTLIYKSNSSSPWLSYQLYLNSSHQPCFTWYNYNNSQEPVVCGSAALSTSTWYHLVGVYDNSSSSLHIYANGTDVTSSPATGTGGMFQSDSPLQLGTGNASAYPHGTFDEIRLSNSVRSSGWIATEYNNQVAPDKATYGSTGFYTVGAAIQGR